jgi:hypothetical protein
MKPDEEIMRILEAYDLCGSFRGAAELAGCDHHTVARYVALRELGRTPGARNVRPRLIEPYLPKLEEWVERSRGRLRGDVAHRKLEALGFRGSDRTTRRALLAAKRAWQQGHRRVYRPWLPEPGMWFQWDYGAGPRVGTRATLLWCAWLAWSRFRVVLPIWDKALPTVVACLDATLRAFGGAPTYGLTDTEKTVTTDHVARLPVRHPELVAAARHYGLTVATCVPADPESKGGSEATVRLAKADLVPTAANLLDAYADFGALEAACRAFADTANARPHRATGRPPVELLAEERQRLHPLPARPFTVVFGQTRTVTASCTISYGGVAYSVPYRLVGQTVWARVHGEELVVVQADGPAGAAEVARHRLSTPGRPQLAEGHYPPRPPGALARQPHPTTPAEAAFLALGEGATRWLVAAAAAGTKRIRTKMADAVGLAALYGAPAVDRALRAAAGAGRFAADDVVALLAHQADLAPERGEAAAAGVPAHAREAHSLQPGTAGWGAVGRPRA